MPDFYIHKVVLVHGDVEHELEFGVEYDIAPNGELRTLFPMIAGDILKVFYA